MLDASATLPGAVGPPYSFNINRQQETADQATNLEKVA
jgi:hypothetical protein